MGNKHIEELHIKRNSWVQSTRENNFEGGIYKLLTELYPDNAHFIYELLQNAEDANATEVEFKLSRNDLNVVHNGRPFNRKDIEGITSIGQGTKADDVNKIGKFGVGFKAVFAYTSTPQIYSSEYNFEITDLVVPSEIDTSSEIDEKTKMIFPFNNPDKPKEKAYSEIKGAMEHLQDNTLLFLDSINKIDYIDESISNSIERINEDDVKVIIANKKAKTLTEWFRFKKYLPESEKLFVSVAYCIGIDDKTKKRAIKPVDGQVSIFFPAEKETSNLRFHLHAPFASTVARDSIKDLEENNQLRDLIADLICESLDYIKQHELLDSNFISCLPIADDHISEFYRPILKRLVYAFDNGEYILTDDGSYQSGSHCYRASANIKKVIDIEMLKVLIDLPRESQVFWIKNPSQRNNRLDKFFQNLNITDMKPEYIKTLLGKLATYLRFSFRIKGNYTDEEVKELLENRENLWFKNLYELLYDLYYRNDISIAYARSLIKLDDDKINYMDEDCYFGNESSKVVSKFNIVHNEVYENNPNKKNQKSKKYLELIGVKEIELKEEVKLLLSEFYYSYSAKVVSKTKHLQHWRLFIKYYKQTNDARIFSNYKILFNNQKVLSKPVTILLDDPFDSTNLSLIDGKIENYYLLDSVYQELKSRKIFVSLLKDLDIRTNIPISKRRLNLHRNYPKLREYGNTSEYTISDDFVIHDLDQLFIENSIPINKLIWDTLVKAEKRILKARYRRIKTSNMNVDLSSLIYDLMEEEWVPDKNGVFYKPCDISKEMLHDDFVYDNTNGWLTNIKFSESIEKNNAEYKEKEKAAKELSGLKPETLNKLKDSGYKDDDILKLIENDKESKNQKIKRLDLKKAIHNTSRSIGKKEIEIDPDVITNEKEYREKAQNELERNLKKSTRSNQRYNSSYDVKIGQKETKEFLNNQYKGHCQICGFTFDLKEGKGKYFEMFNWFSEKIGGQKTNLIEAGSSLCLCSTCHSTIKYGDFNPNFINELLEIEDISSLSFEDFIDLVESRISTEEAPEAFDFIELDMHKTSIRLLNVNQQIFYTEEHFLHFFNMMTLKTLDNKEQPLKYVFD